MPMNGLVDEWKLTNIQWKCVDLSDDDCNCEIAKAKRKNINISFIDFFFRILSHSLRVNRPSIFGSFEIISLCDEEQTCAHH